MKTEAVGSKAHVEMARKAYHAAAERAEAADNDLRERHRKALDAFERDFQRDTIGLRTALIALQRERARAEEEWNAAKVAHAKASDEGLPVGMIVFEWSNKGSFYYSSAKRPWTKTGRKGQVDIWTSASDHPTNERWGLPSVGDKYVRLIKKDGTLSRKFEKLNSWNGTWLPEGAEPKG